MKAIVWDGDDKDSKFTEEEIPADLVDKAAEFRALMIEAAVEMDDDAMGAYLDGKEPDVATLKRLIRKATVKGIFYPMLCGSAFKYKGVQPLLDAVVDYLPSPADREAFEAIDVKTGEPAVRRPVDSDPLSMLAFKIMDDPHVGSITFCRVYSGSGAAAAWRSPTRRATARSGSGACISCTPTTASRSTRPTPATSSRLPGLKDTRTGETLSDPNKAVLLEKMEFPNPVIEMKVEPKTKADVEKMGLALAKLAAEDPSFRVTTDQESGETIIKGMGELHLDIKVDILKRTHKVEVNVGAPQVAYRETLARATEIDYTHKKQTGGTGQFARVKLTLEPNEPGKGNEFESEIVGGVVPKEYIPGVEKGVQSVWDSGVLIGFPMVDTKVTLYDGNYHEVDSSAIAFEIAARTAMREGAAKAGVKLLEPIMDVEVVTPGDFVGSVIGDLNSRRGQIRSQEMRGNATVIRANVPLANMFGYVSQLRSMSQGRAMYTMQFAHYAEVPRNVAEEVKAKYA